VTRSRGARARAQARAARQRRNRLILLAGVAALGAVVALIVAGGVLRDGGGGLDISASRQGRVLGSPAAPVVITAWEDFQCPVCKAANDSVLARIERDYVETGKAQLQFRHFAFLGQESLWAAQAAECAVEQERFWEYHNALFARQAGENRGAFAVTRLKAIASEVGLDRPSFDACLDSRRYAALIDEERREGERLGVKATPTFFVDGRRVPDWRDETTFRHLIERALLAAQ
jgi:protein-disulfide isomerase